MFKQARVYVFCIFVLRLYILRGKETQIEQIYQPFRKKAKYLLKFI